jgi:hypothetical protein
MRQNSFQQKAGMVWMLSFSCVHYLIDEAPAPGCINVRKKDSLQSCEIQVGITLRKI